MGLTRSAGCGHKSPPLLRAGALPRPSGQAARTASPSVLCPRTVVSASPTVGSTLAGVRAMMEVSTRRAEPSSSRYHPRPTDPPRWRRSRRGGSALYPTRSALRRQSPTIANCGPGEAKHPPAAMPLPGTTHDWARASREGPTIGRFHQTGWFVLAPHEGHGRRTTTIASRPTTATPELHPDLGASPGRSGPSRPPYATVRWSSCRHRPTWRGRLPARPWLPHGATLSDRRSVVHGSRP